MTSNPDRSTANADGLVQIRDVHKHFTRGNERIDVLKGVSLDIPQGDYLALMGPSGSGKTTLLNLMGGLDTPTEGVVDMDGLRVSSLRGSRLSRWRSGNIGFVFQLYNLLPKLTAEKNVELPLLLTKLSKTERRERVAIALKVVGLADRAKHYPSQLSGGQEQRVGIARAIVTDPALLLCDEPTGDLDRKASEEILDLLQALNRDHGKTIVMVTHDPHAAERASEPCISRRVSLGRRLMRFLPLIWMNVWRRRIRTTFTLLSIFIAFMLFGIVMTVRAAFSLGVEIAGIDRLVLINKVTLIMPLPISYKRQHATDAGSRSGDAPDWFNGAYQKPTNVLDHDGGGAGVVHPDLSGDQAPPEQVEAWRATGRAPSWARISRRDMAGRLATGSH